MTRWFTRVRIQAFHCLCIWSSRSSKSSEPLELCCERVLSEDEPKELDMLEDAEDVDDVEETEETEETEGEDDDDNDDDDNDDDDNDESEFA